MAFVVFLVPHSGVPQMVLDNDNFKLLHDFNTYTDRRILARRRDIVYMDKGSGCTKLLDVACVMDRHVVDLVLVLNSGQQLQQGNISLIGQGPFSQSISNFFPMIVKIVLELI